MILRDDYYNLIVSKVYMFESTPDLFWFAYGSKSLLKPHCFLKIDFRSILSLRLGLNDVPYFWIFGD